MEDPFTFHTPVSFKFSQISYVACEIKKCKEFQLKGDEEPERFTASQKSLINQLVYASLSLSVLKTENFRKCRKSETGPMTWKALSWPKVSPAPALVCPGPLAHVRGHFPI